MPIDQQSPSPPGLEHDQAASAVEAALGLAPPRSGADSAAPVIEILDDGIQVTPSVDESNLFLDLSVTRLTRDRGGHSSAKEGLATHTDEGSTLAARQFEDGLQIFEVLADKSSNHRIRYRAHAAGLPVSFVLNEDGTVAMSIVDPTDGQPREIGVVDQPWAFDANGSAVEASYQVNGNSTQLTLKVDKAEAYPVVVDPSIHTTWYGLITLKVETYYANKVRGTIIAGGGASAVGAWACAGLTGGICSVPFALGAALAAIGSGALLVCQNSKGFDIHAWGLPPANGIWCSGY